MKYSIRLTRPNGGHSYLFHRGKSVFSLATARKYLGELRRLGNPLGEARIEDEFNNPWCPRSTLIAAAPELLAALQGLMARSAKDAETYAPDGNEPIWAWINDASDAIAKATGKEGA